MPDFELPNFGLESYANLMMALCELGYDFRLVSMMAHLIDRPSIYLRHDIDLHIAAVVPMAELEASQGLAATYYVPLTLHFNPLYPENRSVIRRLRELGHDIGLHYDLETYPTDPEEARRHLDWEIGILEAISGGPVRTLCMHQPFKGQSDPFRQLDEYVNPHDPRSQGGLLYVSDSCRAWRDEGLLRCFAPDRPHRVLINTHPELWLDGSVADRLAYLASVLTTAGTLQHREYFENSVRSVWLTHPGPKLHDEREAHRTQMLSP